MPDLNPFNSAKQDAENALTRAWHKIVDLRKTYVTAVLLYAVGGSSVAVAAAVLSLPLFAYVAVTVMIVALLVHAIYTTKIMKAQDAENRWAYVAGKRVEQRNVEAKIAMDTVTLALMGERHAPDAMRSASPELRAALAHHQHRLHLAQERAAAAEAVKEGTATDAERRALVRFQRRQAVPPPDGPAIEPIKARRAAHNAERKVLEAEISALATAEDIDAAMKAEEVQGARRTRRERQDAAARAEQVARERKRAGKPPTVPEPEHVLTLQLNPNGARDVRSGRGAPTPEQIAKGEDAA